MGSKIQAGYGQFFNQLNLITITNVVREIRGVGKLKALRSLENKKKTPVRTCGVKADFFKENGIGQVYTGKKDLKLKNLRKVLRYGLFSDFRIVVIYQI